MPPGVLRGELYLTYVHCQTNPQTCTKFGANRSSRLTASQYFWICDSLNPPPLGNALWGIEGRIVFGIKIPRLIRRRVPNLVPIGPAVWQLPRLLNVWPLKTPSAPLFLEGQYVWRISIPRWICTCAKFGANGYSRLTASQYFWICDPIKSPEMPLGYWGANCV